MNEEIIKLIPKQYRNSEFRFLLNKKKGKEPIEKDWAETNNYKFYNKKLIEHIKKGGNYGIIGGYGNLVIIDSDSKKINELCKLLPETFTIKTGSKEDYKIHYYYILDKKIKPIRFTEKKVGDLGDIRSVGQYVIACNSIHPSGNKYKVMKDIPIQTISEQFLRSIFKDYIESINSVEQKNKSDYPIDTKKRDSKFVRNCNVPDYVLNNKLEKKNTGKNWRLFPAVVDVLNARGVSNELYERLAEMQSHKIGAVAGWVKKSKEGKLAKSSCNKMREYLNCYYPELIEEVCGNCSLYKKIKEEEEEKKEEELKEKLLKEHKEKISKDKDVNELLKNPDLLEIIDKEFDKKIVKENESRKVIFLITNMRNVENLGKGTDNLIVNAISGTGKDHITESIFEILPEEEKEELVKTTPKVLSYTRNKQINPNASWKKTALRMEDVTNSVVNDDSFKVFLSANPNKINCGKSVNKGKVIEIEIEGKPSMILTIASSSIGDEQLRRLPNLFLNEGVNQTKEILKRQAKYAVEGKVIEYNPKITNALSILKRVKVKIPYAEKLVKIFENSTKNVIVRTAFPRFLDYIKSSASLHQYQREKDEEGNIIANEQDYELGAMCLRKTTNNILMIPLSKLDDTLYGFFVKNELEKISIEELFNLEVIQGLGKGERWIRKRLDFLVSKRFLKRKSVKEEGINKPINRYSFNRLQNFQIPKFKELTSNKTYNTNNTNNTNSSNKGVNELFELNEMHSDINIFENSGIKEELEK